MGSPEPYYKGNHKRCIRCGDIKPGVHFPRKSEDVCSLCINKENEKEVNSELVDRRRKIEERIENKRNDWDW